MQITIVMAIVPARMVKFIVLFSLVIFSRLLFATSYPMVKVDSEYKDDEPECCGNL